MNGNISHYRKIQEHFTLRETKSEDEDASDDLEELEEADDGEEPD